jgi:hypothetical protein
VRSVIISGRSRTSAVQLKPTKMRHEPPKNLGVRERNYTSGTIKTYRALSRPLGTMMQSHPLAPSCHSAERAAESLRGERRTATEPHKWASIIRGFARHLIEICVAAAPSQPARQTARETLPQGYGDNAGLGTAVTATLPQ